LAAFLVESMAGRDGSIHQDIYIHDEALPPGLKDSVFGGTGFDHLSYRWASDYTLEIHYDTTCTILKFTNRWSRPSDVAAGRPNPIEIVLIPK